MSEPLHLARVLLPYETAAKRRLVSPYDWHQAAWEAFPHRDQQPRDFLTRVDQKDDGVQLLLLCHTPPQRPPWCPEPGWNVKEIPDTFFHYPSYRFSLLANPTVKRSVDGKKNGRREPITVREDLLAWLERHAGAAGFRTDGPHVRTVVRPRERFFRQGSTPVTLHAVEYQGTLKITDAALFREHFAKGLGSAKAFGFGMLAVAPSA